MKLFFYGYSLAKIYVGNIHVDGKVNIQFGLNPHYQSILHFPPHMLHIKI